MALLVGGGALSLRQKSERRLPGIILGLMGFISSVWLYSWFFPLDWFLPGYKLRVTNELPGMRVDFIQEPGNDFYRNYVELIKPDGTRTQIYEDIDSYKCWTLRSVIAQGEIHYACNGQLRKTVHIAIEEHLVYASNQCPDGCRFDELFYK